MAKEGEIKNLGKPLYELIPGFLQTRHLIRAEFDDKDILSIETLQDLFDNNCVTQIGSMDDRALGFLDKIPTEAITLHNVFYIYAIHYIPEEMLQKWYNAIFGNLFAFDNGTIKGADTCIYDKEHGWLIDVEFASRTSIRLLYYYDEEI